MGTADAKQLADKIDALQDDGSEGVPWSQEELDLIARALRAYVSREGCVLVPLEPTDEMIDAVAAAYPGQGLTQYARGIYHAMLSRISGG